MYIHTHTYVFTICVVHNMYVQYSKDEMKHKFRPVAHSGCSFRAPSEDKPASPFSLSLDNEQEADLSLSQESPPAQTPR